MGQIPIDPGKRHVRTVLAVPESTRTVRRFVIDQARSWGVRDEVVDSVGLIASELFTNVVDQVRDAWVWVGIAYNGGRPMVEVWDPLDAPDEVPVVEDAWGDAEREDGRGLLLVQALAADWGHRREPGAGKVVWALVE